MEIVGNQSIKNLIEEAQAAEDSSDFENAASLYKSIIEKDPLQQLAYDRLFIMLRKLKDYKQELKFLKAGIKAFESLGKAGRKASRKISELSSLLNKATGLTDKKGNTVYKPEPIARWEKRMLVTEKRIKKK